MRLSLLLVLAFGCQPDTKENGDTSGAEETGTPDTDTDPVEDDGDGDGFAAADDCDDADATVNPGADEVCNGRDDDCDGGVDLGASDATRWYDDDDADGYGGEATIACEQPPGAVEVGGDCHDQDADVFPGGTESCNGLDDDCDGTTDEAGTLGESTWYTDADLDGYGDEATMRVSCDPGAGYSAVAGDCDDTSALATPDGAEVCGDGLDNDCSGEADACSFVGAEAPGSQDVRLTGATAEALGSGLAVGDFDGDGQSDVVGGAPELESGGYAGGLAYWYGPVTTSETSADADAWVTGIHEAGGLGAALAAGDHDGDGIDDLVACGPGATGAGAVELVYGGARLSGTMDAGAAGFDGVDADDAFGASLALGHLDGDGSAELVAGAAGVGAEGAAYLFYGTATLRAGAASASTADVVVTGYAAGDALGTSVAVITDMTGDGLGDLLVGAPGSDPAPEDAGAAYLFPGESGWLPASVAPADSAVAWSGSLAYDAAGDGVYDLGDLDGDGYGDAGVYGSGYDSGGADAVGALWVYAGGAILTTIPVATLHGTTAGGAFGGASVAPGDLDADGAVDLLVGSRYDATEGTDAGAAFLYAGPITGTLTTTDAVATFYGAGGASAEFGARLVGPVDLTGDTLPDVVIAGPGDDGGMGGISIWAGRGGE